MGKVNKPKMIVVHGSASPHGKGHDAKAIHRWHMAPPRKWDGIGYHYVILEDGTLQAGRPEFWEGAHVRGYNNNSLGICLIGNGSYTAAQLETLAKLLGEKMQQYNILSKKVYGHSDLDPKKPNCPGFNVLEFVISRVIGGEIGS